MNLFCPKFCDNFYITDKNRQLWSSLIVILSSRYLLRPLSRHSNRLWLIFFISRSKKVITTQERNRTIKTQVIMNNHQIIGMNFRRKFNEKIDHVWSKIYDRIKKSIFEGRSIDHDWKSIFDRNHCFTGYFFNLRETRFCAYGICAPPLKIFLHRHAPKVITKSKVGSFGRHNCYLLLSDVTGMPDISLSLILLYDCNNIIWSFWFFECIIIWIIKKKMRRVKITWQVQYCTHEQTTGKPNSSRTVRTRRTVN